jgi:glycosyltransferase involved in cell wall biosynthesis
VTTLTVTVISHNEASHIAAALESVSWADEIIVIDSHSTDATVEIARRYATRVEVRDWAGYGAQKNYAADRASNDWILSIDADERVTPELAAEIREVMRRGPVTPGYQITRVAHYLGQWIRSTDWYPDYHLRLYDRRAARWSERRVHESVEVDGRPKGGRHLPRLRGELLHYPYRDMSDHLRKIDRYTTLAAEQWEAEGKRATALHALVYPRLAFFRNFLLRRGFSDGRVGLLVSLLNSYYVFLKYAKLIELRTRERQSPLHVPDGPARNPPSAVAAPDAAPGKRSD